MGDIESYLALGNIESDVMMGLFGLIAPYHNLKRNVDHKTPLTVYREKYQVCGFT